MAQQPDSQRIVSLLEKREGTTKTPPKSIGSKIAAQAMNLHRSSSAPPTLAPQEKSATPEPSLNDLKQQEYRMDPTYHDYYYSQRPLDPRLPHPLFAWNRPPIPCVPGDNGVQPSGAPGGEDSDSKVSGSTWPNALLRLNGQPSDDLVTPDVDGRESTLPADERDQLPALSSAALPGATAPPPGIMGIPGSSLPKSVLEMIQHDFPRTPSPIYQKRRTDEAPGAGNQQVTAHPSISGGGGGNVNVDSGSSGVPIIAASVPPLLHSHNPPHSVPPSTQSESQLGLGPQQLPQSPMPHAPLHRFGTQGLSLMYYPESASLSLEQQMQDLSVNEMAPAGYPQYTHNMTYYPGLPPPAHQQLYQHGTSPAYGMSPYPMNAYVPLMGYSEAMPPPQNSNSLGMRERMPQYGMPDYSSMAERQRQELLMPGMPGGYTKNPPNRSAMMPGSTPGASPKAPGQRGRYSWPGPLPPRQPSERSSGSREDASNHETTRSSLLEEFRSNKGREFTLKDIVGHMGEFCQDQHGSRFIQTRLEDASDAEKEQLFHEVLPLASSLMVDVFGNYVIQKIFEHGSDAQRTVLAQRLSGQVLSLSLQMYGCRVVQKAVEALPTLLKDVLCQELRGHVLQCVKDQNGNHVIQKCIEFVEPRSIQFIVDAFQGQVFQLASHPYGCRVIQRILEHCHAEQAAGILEELLRCTVALVQDQYGNYVVQHVLERGSEKHKSVIIQKLLGQICQLSQHKYASNAIERCVQYATPSERELILTEILGPSKGDSSQLLGMVKDPFGNYVVQKMLDVASDAQRDMLISRIRPHVPALKKYTYGKHIIARIEKALNSSRS